jgi:hypothetical protein
MRVEDVVRALRSLMGAATGSSSFPVCHAPWTTTRRSSRLLHLRGNVALSPDLTFSLLALPKG